MFCSEVRDDVLLSRQGSLNIQSERVREGGCIRVNVRLAT